MLSEVSQTAKDKYCMLSLICGKQTSEYNKKKKQTHRYRERTSNLLFDGMMLASFPFVCVLGYSVVLHSL